MSLRSALELGHKTAQDSKLDLFHFLSKGKVEHRLRVLRFHGEERVNTPYEIDLELLAPMDVDPVATLEDALLGNPGTLVMMDGPEAARVIHGVVTGYEVIGSLDRESVRIRARLGARLSLLKMRQHSRIFQEETIPAIAERVLKEWRIAHSFELVGRYAPRTYVTQYQESDYDFLRRILAREGIFFYFRQTPGADSEELILSDDALYKPTSGRRSKITMRSGRFEVGESEVVEMGVRRRLRPTAGRMGDYDFRNPRLPLRSLDLAEDTKGITGDLGSDRLGWYMFGHEGEQEHGATAQKREEDAARLLQSLRNDGLAVVGTSRTRSLVPGHSFSLDGHTLETLNRDWVVVAVLHEGKTPEFAADASDVYYNEFEAAPIETALRMPVEVRSRVAQGSQTATVVGGSDGEVFADASGRIKVQFHWDLEGRNDDKSSCWIRVAQPWAGPGFGAQFLPRVGTEVVVTFLDGDPDRPLVIGSVYNGTHPPPFGLPNQKHKSGFRTSTPGAEGGNELSFDDEQGKELINLKAQRDLALDVGHDHTETVAGNSMLEVKGQRTENVTGSHTITVAGGQTNLVTLHQTTQILGDAISAVRGTADRRVSGNDNLRVEGTARSDLDTVETFVARDASSQVKGHLVGVVGESENPTSATLHVEGTLAGYSSKTTELISEEGIVFRCGESSIRVGPNSVEILSPLITMAGLNIEAATTKRFTVASHDGILMKAQRFHAMGKSSSVRLFKDAEIGGDKVKLNCEMDDAAVLALPKSLTTIQLVDEAGAPAGGRKYVIVTSDGERSGVLNDQGEAELELDADAQIYFPDVDKVREG
jgi:type VI secretion system secreted protein VgrG